MTRAAAWLMVGASLLLQGAGLALLSVAAWLHPEQTKRTYARALRHLVDRSGNTVERVAQDHVYAMRTYLGDSSPWLAEPREIDPNDRISMGIVDVLERKQRLHELGLCCGCEAPLESYELELGLCAACDPARAVDEPPP